SVPVRTMSRPLDTLTPATPASLRWRRPSPSASKNTRPRASPDAACNTPAYVIAATKSAIRNIRNTTFSAVESVIALEVDDIVLVQTDRLSQADRTGLAQMHFV